MLRLAILLSLLPYTLSTSTKPYITFFWKTTAVTDQFIDYWNHGPIFIPGLQNVYTMTTKAADIFPPWLTRVTKTTTLGTTTMFKKKTVKLTKPSTSPTTTITTPLTTITTAATPATPLTTKPPIEFKTTETQPTPNTEINTTHRPKPEKQFSFEEADNQGPTDPFSAFLRKLLRTLSVKGHSELPPLFTPFSSYMAELIMDGDLNELGYVVLTYAKNMIKKLDALILTPDKLHTLCYQAYNMLTNRHTALAEDTNNLLNFLDDMYDEGEEEVMQIVLREATKFPNTDTTADEIAYGFVNNAILLPMTRINGTSKGDSLVEMMTAAVLKRSTSSRRHLGNIHREKRSRDNNEVKKNKIRFTENKYKSIRNNLDNINRFIDNLKLGNSSSDTSAYEYELSEDDDTDNTKVKEVEHITKKTNNNQIHIFKTNSDDDGESLLENDEDNKNMDYGQTDKVKPNIKSIFDKLERFLRVTDKSTVIPKESSIHFRFGNIQKYLNNERTVLFPGHLMTKLEQKRIQYDSVTKRHKTSRYAYFTDARPKPITKLHKLPKSQIKNERDAELKIKIDVNNLASNNLIHHQYKSGSKNEALAKMLLKRNPFYLDANEGLERLQPLQVFTLKPLSNLITKHTPKTRITIKMVKTALRNTKNKIQNKENIVKNITQHNVNANEHVKTRLKEETADESDDSDTYSEKSSETFGGRKPSNNRKSKYEKLKRKYNILKRLSEQILAQNMANIKREQISPDLIHKKVGEIADNNKVSDDNSNFYNPVQETTRNMHKKIKINNINLFLNDYDGKIEFESDSQETPPVANKVVDYNDIIRKSFPLSKTTDNSANVTEVEYSDAEKELKRNIYDAIRHMDFINYNASRRSEDVKSIIRQESHETDVEAVLKTNIYKAVKKLLKT